MTGEPLYDSSTHFLLLRRNVCCIAKVSFVRRNINDRYLEEMLKGLPNPKSVWKYMLAVTQIPRGSNDEGENFRHKKILSFLKEQAEALHCETYVDKGENLIIRKAAYPGRNYPTC